MGNILTLEDLKAMEPNTIFATGCIEDKPLGLNMGNSGKMLRWVAVRGGIWDWTIYVLFADKSEYEIKSNGDKVYSKEHIRRLVPCDDESFAMYRF